MRKVTSALTPEDREELRAQVARDVEEYLAKGGEITPCPPRAYSTPAVGYSRYSDSDSNRHTVFKGYNVAPVTDPIKRLIGGYIPRFADSKNEN